LVAARLWSIRSVSFPGVEVGPAERGHVASAQHAVDAEPERRNRQLTVPRSVVPGRSLLEGLFGARHLERGPADADTVTALTATARRHITSASTTAADRTHDGERALEAWI
jgi:hypothetical protein